MRTFWTCISLGAFLVIAESGLSSRALAAEGGEEPAQTVPAKALILGVPYVSWSEAAQLRYEHKDILNPSYVAVGKMVRGYWGQDPRFYAKRNTLPPPVYRVWVENIRSQAIVTGKD